MSCNCGGASNHEHVVDGPNSAILKSLLPYIIVSNCSVLNGRKPYILEKLFTDENQNLESDIQEEETQLIIKIPYFLYFFSFF